MGAFSNTLFLFTLRNEQARYSAATCRQILNDTGANRKLSSKTLVR